MDILFSQFGTGLRDLAPDISHFGGSFLSCSQGMGFDWLRGFHVVLPTCILACSECTWLSDDILIFSLPFVFLGPRNTYDRASLFGVAGNPPPNNSNSIDDKHHK